MTATQPRLTITPITLRAANRFVGLEHRHHPPTTGHKFSVGVIDEEQQLVGVAVAGRPVNRELQKQGHLEVLRVATNGTPNACSALYGATARVGREMGYPRWMILTYTLDTEPGTSLRAAGWVLDGQTRGESWDRPGRARKDRAPTTPKLRWRAARRPFAVWTPQYDDETEQRRIDILRQRHPDGRVARRDVTDWRPADAD